MNFQKVHCNTRGIYSLFSVESGDYQQAFAWESFTMDDWQLFSSFKKQWEPTSFECKTQTVPKQPTKITSEWKTEFVIGGLASIICPPTYSRKKIGSWVSGNSFSKEDTGGAATKPPAKHL